MSSDMFMFDEPYYHNLDSNLLSREISGNFFTDPLSALSDSSIDSILQEISDDHNPNNTTTTTTTTTITTQISADEAQSLDQIAQTLFSNSPPSHLLETLSLCQQQTHLSNLPNSCSLPDGSSDYPVSDIKTEDFHLDYYFLGNHSYSGGESVLKFMQRSYSSNSFEGKPGFFFQPRFNNNNNTLLLESQNFQGLSSPEFDSSFNGGQIRRVFSTGDLPEEKMNQTSQQRVCSSSPLGGGGEGNFMEEGNFKVGRYSAEERKERIDRYRAKRTQRNFNKTIKYACRKTLADNRPRIRGRFARNDETGEIPKHTCFPRYEEDDHWVDNVREEDQEGILLSNGEGGRFLTNFGGTHFQYYGY